MSGYIGNIPTPQATQTRDTFTATSGQTTFATSGYTPNFVLVWLNGVLLQEGTDYTASNGSDVVLTTGAAAGDTLEVVAFSTFEASDVTASSGFTVTGNLSVDGGTIKLDGNYPVGTENVALGNAALDSVTTGGDYNVAIGNDALTANTTGNRNIAIGEGAMQFNTTGYRNVGIGRTALSSNTDGFHNVAIGMDAVISNTTGDYNVGVGSGSLQSNTTASSNTAVGYQAGYASTTATENALHGYRAGYTVTTGSQNSFFGAGSGSVITTGSKNTIIGRYNGNNGGLDIRTSNNYIVLSDGDGNPRFYINNNGLPYAPTSYSTTTATAANMYIQPNGAFYRSTSSARYKNTITDATHGLTELLTLRPVTYKGNNDGDTVFGGLIAEEVHDAGLTEFVQYNDEGQPDALAYGNMVSLCIKAIQEQQATIEALEARIATLEAN